MLSLKQAREMSCLLMFGFYGVNDVRIELTLVFLKMTQESKKKPKEKESIAENESKKSISYSQLFRFATPFDRFLVTMGCIFSAINGSVLPVIVIFFSDIMNALIIYNPVCSGFFA